MHYTGTIWRPPYEAQSLLLEVTAGCTHHNCKFCTLYDGLPFQFRMTPMETIDADLAEAQMLLHSPLGKLRDNHHPGLSGWRKPVYPALSQTGSNCRGSPQILSGM